LRVPLRSRRALAVSPAYSPQPGQWLKFVDFVPISDQLLRGKITEECQKALGIKLNIETIAVRVDIGPLMGWKSP
jgi:hypothetical protein